MDSTKAIQKLEQQKNLVSSLKNHRNSPAFSKWQRDTRVDIEHIFSGNERHVREFSSISYHLGTLGVYTNEIDRVQKFNRGLDEAVALLDSMINEISLYGLGKTQELKEVLVGNNVFIGHGRSPLWRELKDFIKDKLNLPHDEFNRVPVAGLSNALRLQQMLDQASIAFLVMTAEDENLDGNKQARMNVIHEVGLFQGRLGFERAIVLLEEGCEEFSNINGLGQIRFPTGNISAIFQDIRDVLEREKIIN